MVMTFKSFYGCLWTILLLKISWINCTSVRLTVEGEVSLVGPHCPGTVRLLCEGVELVSLRWQYNGDTSVISYFPDGVSTTQSEETAFFNVQLSAVRQNPNNPSFGNFSSFMFVNLTDLQSNSVSDISCDGPAADISQVVPVNVSIIRPSIPNSPVITMVTAEYQSGEIKRVEVNWLKPNNFCPSHELLLSYEVNITAFDSVKVICVEELCGTIFSNLTGRTVEFLVSLRAENELGTSGLVYFPILITHQAQQYFVPEVFISNNQVFGRCTSAEGLITGCSVQYTTDPMYMNLSAPIQVPLDTDILILELPIAERTYYLVFSANVNNTFQIIDSISFIARVQTDNSSQVVIPVIIVLVVVLMVIIGAVVVVLVVMIVSRRKGTSPSSPVQLEGIPDKPLDKKIGISVIYMGPKKNKLGRKIDDQFKIVMHRSQEPDNPYAVLRWWSEFETLLKEVKHWETEDLKFEIPSKLYKKDKKNRAEEEQYQRELREFILKLVKDSNIQKFPPVEKFLALDSTQYDEERHKYITELDLKGMKYVTEKDNSE